jgi:DNA-directed RNA polymerase sigma subunit (sigma70/sigma32)
MAMDLLTERLADHRFAELFRDELGWDLSSLALAVKLQDWQLEFEGVAQKCGFPVLKCDVEHDVLSDQALLRRAQGKIATTNFEHILIYASQNPPEQVWQWAVRLPDGRGLRHTGRPFVGGSPPGSLLKQLNALSFPAGEVADVASAGALRRVRAALEKSPETVPQTERTSLLHRSDKLALAVARGKKGAIHEFVLLHRGLARVMSKPYVRRYDVEPEDAEQIARLGLIMAAQRFDIARGVRFSTYACHWAISECMLTCPNYARLIRVPNRTRGVIIPMRQQLKRLTAQFGPGPANDELARWCAQDAEFYRRWLAVERALDVRSLSDQSRFSYRQALKLPAPAVDDPLEVRERHQRLHAALLCLSARDRRVLWRRHTMEGPDS